MAAWRDESFFAYSQGEDIVCNQPGRDVAM